MTRACWVTLFCVAWCCALAHAQTVGSTQVLAPLAGALATSAPGQQNIGFYGTDLGSITKHGQNLHILFGDTWSNNMGVPIAAIADDSVGDISLSTFPDGDSVETWISQHLPSEGVPSWHASAPPVTFRLNATGQVAPITLYRGGLSGTLLNTGLYRTAMASFSNARADSSGASFAIYWRDVTTECSGGTSPHCSVGTCDTAMGSCFGFGGENDLPCVFGTSRCLCLPVPGGGICQDRSSSVYDTTEDGRILATVMRMEVGNADPSQPERHYTQSWYTNKFLNPVACTVNDFDPSRANGVGNDYRPADGAAPLVNEKVLLWGRPNYAGIGASGRDAELYFAYVDMPSYSATGAFAWAPKYFTGLVNGVPQFSTSVAAAVPLDLSAGTSNPIHSSVYERFDIVGMTSVHYLAALQKWVMFYGGDFASSTLDYLLGLNYRQAVRDPNGAIHARFASQPWGPWSAPVQVFAAGDPSTSPPVAGSPYASGGVLFHPACRSSACAPGEPSEGTSEYGRLYFPNIIEPWTMSRVGGAVDVYWNVSTWNPYEVVLMKTRINP